MSEGPNMVRAIAHLDAKQQKQIIEIMNVDPTFKNLNLGILPFSNAPVIIDQLERTYTFGDFNSRLESGKKRKYLLQIIRTIHKYIPEMANKEYINITLDPAWVYGTLDNAHRGWINNQLLITGVNSHVLNFHSRWTRLASAKKTGIIDGVGHLYRAYANPVHHKQLRAWFVSSRIGNAS